MFSLATCAAKGHPIHSHICFSKPAKSDPLCRINTEAVTCMPYKSVTHYKILTKVDRQHRMARGSSTTATRTPLPDNADSYPQTLDTSFMGSYAS